MCIELQTEVKYTDKELSYLRSGRDKFSSIRINNKFRNFYKLGDALNMPVGEVAKCVIMLHAHYVAKYPPNSLSRNCGYAYMLSALRWMARGLSQQDAIRKVRIDRELTYKFYKTNPYRRSKAVR